jgi:hypothetical protein
VHRVCPKWLDHVSIYATIPLGNSTEEGSPTMTETATETTETKAAEAKATEATPVPVSQIDYDKTFGAFAATFKGMLPQLDIKANEHNELVARLKVKEGEISEDDLEGARLRNKAGDPKVTKLNQTIEAALAKVEELKAQAYELTKNDIPQPLSEEERPKVQEKVKTLRAEFKQMDEAIQTVAGSLGVKLDGIKLPTITANARTVGGGGQTGHQGPRIRTTDVFVDDNRVEAPKAGKPDETTSTLSVAANVISKAVKSKVAAADLQAAYFAAAGTSDYESIDSDFEFTYVYESGEHKREFKIRVVK